MRLRVTSIAGQEFGARITDTLLWLEDWLNALLGDGDFGGDLDCLMILVCATDCLVASDESGHRELGKSRSGSSKNPFNGETVRFLDLSVYVEPEEILLIDSSQLSSQVCKLIVARIPEKLKRTPKGLEYGRLRQALVASLSVHINPK